jgi:AraC-type DNA-binding domain-containing proteins
MEGSIDIGILKDLMRNHANLSRIKYVTDKLAFLDSIEAQKLKEISRFDMLTFALCTSGFCKIKVNMKEYEMSPRSLIVIFPNQYIQLDEMNGDCRGEVIFTSLDVVKEFSVMVNNMASLFLYVRKNPCVMLSEERYEMIESYVDLIFRKSDRMENMFASEIMRNLLLALFCEVCNIFGHEVILSQKVKTRNEEIYEHFMLLVSENYKKEHFVKFYADKMHITQRYLSTVIKDFSKSSPSDWIDQYVLTEAKILLNDSGKTVQQISNELNFKNQSFFGKYFRKHTGMTPLQYRKKQ